MAKRHFLQQCHTFNPNKHSVEGWLISEKFDNQRAFWDGGITRGMKKAEVPWANTDKDARYKKEQFCSGLWSRYGHPIQAPDWFLDMLPYYPLDGELGCGRNQYQKTRKIVSRQTPDPDAWKDVQFRIFDSPKYSDIFFDSFIDLPNYKKEFKDIEGWLVSLGRPLIQFDPPSFESLYRELQSQTLWNNHLILIPQYQLPANKGDCKEFIDFFLSEVLSLGGEGIVIRNPASNYTPERVHHSYKHKPFLDSEATVVGYISGMETDKGSKLLGLMGAMIVEWEGKRFKLSGFTDQERQLNKDDASIWACQNPGTQLPKEYYAKSFPPGTKVTFKYRELSDDGIPKEARFMRKKENV